jgi:general secretion pathway protein M
MKLIKRPLTPLENRSLAIALLILCLILGGSLVVVPILLMHRHYDLELESNRDLLLRYRNMAAARGEIEASLARARTHDGKKYFLKSTTEVLAAAEIQEMARGAIESNGCKLLGAQAGTLKDEGDYRRVTVNVQSICTDHALKRMLHAVETLRPFLFIDNLGVRSLFNAQNMANPGLAPEVKIQFDLSGYMLPLEEK